ncbi:hypothetical protein D9756_003270 [Leucocoprinus leucothites]|uniref:Uncharacterized protein n=1 Tax=Leucocoprinus leucothites TaxID=201217 RepID=A0A8H5LJL8_9AGAR|nr:hypothetical protein D9756_003270 [Leucoagaricus leucothites]
MGFHLWRHTMAEPLQIGRPLDAMVTGVYRDMLPNICRTTSFLFSCRATSIYALDIPFYPVQDVLEPGAQRLEYDHECNAGKPRCFPVSSAKLLSEIMNITVSGQQVQRNCMIEDLDAAIRVTVISCTVDRETYPTFERPTMLRHLYTIDFSMIPGGTDSASFYFWDIESTREAIESTEPTILWPGARLFGTLVPIRRESTTNPGAAVFGIPQHRRYWVGNIRSLLPDPFAPPPSLGNQIASLHIMLSPTQPNVLIEKESPENSVLDGFALLGGVWTFVNGLFCCVFGTTLMLILFDIKPLSVYGLVHVLFWNQDALSEPPTNNLSGESQAHVVAILREHLLDVPENPRTGDVKEPESNETSEKVGSIRLSEV